MLLNKCQSTRAGKSKQLLNALQRFNTKCLLLAVAGGGEGEGAEKGDWVKHKYFAWRRALWAVTGGEEECGAWGRGTYTVLMLFMASNVPLASD